MVRRSLTMSAPCKNSAPGDQLSTGITSIGGDLILGWRGTKDLQFWGIRSKKCAFKPRCFRLVPLSVFNVWQIKTKQ